MRRFWTMLAHWHGQTWNASELGRSLAVSDKTVRSYLDLLTGTYMVRQLQPWFENTAKRQVKAPKVYFRDTGLLHALLGLSSDAALLAHPRVGASWEGFVIEEVLSVLKTDQAWFWAAHGGGEVDLLLMSDGKRVGIEVKFSEAPNVTRPMQRVLQELSLAHLFVVCPARDTYPVEPSISVWPVHRIADLPARIAAL